MARKKTFFGVAGCNFVAQRGERERARVNEREREKESERERDRERMNN